MWHAVCGKCLTSSPASASRSRPYPAPRQGWAKIGAGQPSPGAGMLALSRSFRAPWSHFVHILARKPLTCSSDR